MPDGRRREAQLNDLLALCLEAERLGVPLDYAEVLTRHQRFASELLEFFEANRWIKEVASPLSVGDRDAAAPSSKLTALDHGTRVSRIPFGTPTVNETVKTETVKDESGCIRLGKYRLIREIGRGGMGVVYEGWQEGVNRPVAVKVISSGPFASTEELKRFRTEAEAAANLSHPGLVPIYEVDVCEGRPFYSMELVVGKSLADLASAGELTADRAAEFVAAVADAVDYAHRRGIVHRDLKPANVLIDSTGRPRVTDFGLAKRLGNYEPAGSQSPPSDVTRTFDVDAPIDTRTRTGTVLGTPAYMAPEQAAGDRNVGPAADVYGLGAILYHLLTGRPPFRAATAIDTLRLVLDGRVEAVRNVNPAIPADLATIVETCLNRLPDDRYRSAADLAVDLRRFRSGEPIHAGRMSLWGRVTRVVGQSRHISHFRHWGRVIVTFGVIVFLAHLAMQLLNWAGAGEVWMIATRAVMFGLLLGVLRWSRSGSLFPRDAVERLVWVVWTAYLLAYATVLILNIVAGHGHAAMYPVAAVLAGMAFFTLGCHVWGACYLVGLAFFLASPLLAFAPEYAVLGLGALWGLSLTALGLRYDRLNRMLPIDD